MDINNAFWTNPVWVGGTDDFAVNRLTDRRSNLIIGTRMHATLLSVRWVRREKGGNCFLDFDWRHDAYFTNRRCKK
ncbi:hypothetical protein BH11PSE11_BH11PSE11_14290 [soil metagenome]